MTLLCRPPHCSFKQTCFHDNQSVSLQEQRQRDEWNIGQIIVSDNYLGIGVDNLPTFCFHSAVNRQQSTLIQYTEGVLRI